ncbi:unnamed protein product [Protopolystoma xenopodis]|uniref:Uncharacterized protein n=1 Tax=Protopolystoma xenopodis TaxID=117903 RepID=A0A448XL50_9PLAT|nr:unnamed protein product [Protopolystoma xenopodis]
MLPRSVDVRQMRDESLAPFNRNRRRLPRKQRQHECSSKANRQRVKRNRPSSSGGTELRISSPNTFTQNGISLINPMFPLSSIDDSKTSHSPSQSTPEGGDIEENRAPLSLSPIWSLGGPGEILFLNNLEWENVMVSGDDDKGMGMRLHELMRK